MLAGCCDGGGCGVDVGSGRMGRLVRGARGVVAELGVGVGRTSRLPLNLGEEVKSGGGGDEPESSSTLWGDGGR